MKHTFFSFLTGLSLVVLLLSPSCSNVSDETGDLDSGSDTDTSSVTGSDTDSDIDVDTDGDTDTDTSKIDAGNTICDEQDFEIEVTPVALVWLLDVSSSMTGTPLTQAKTAINNILTMWGTSQIQFGFDYFPSATSCVVNTTIPVTPGIDSETTISGVLTSLGTTVSTPLYTAINQYISFGYAPGFPMPGVASYLVVVSDGGDTCTSPTVTDFQNVTTSLLANGIKSFAIGFNYSSASLDAIAASGGMPAPFNTTIPATDATTLQNAFNSIANAVATCTFDVKSPDASADHNNVNFYFDGVLIPLNQGCTGSEYGWQWVDIEHTQVEFCPNSCDEIQDGDAPEIGAKWGCPTIVG